MGLVLIAFAVVLVIAVLVGYGYVIRRITDQHLKEMARIDREYQQRKKEIDAFYGKAEDVSPELLKSYDGMSSDYAKLVEDWNALQRDQTVLHRAWQRVGDTMQEVIDSAPPPEECKGMTPDEFEEAIRQNLKERRKQ